MKKLSYRLILFSLIFKLTFFNTITAKANETFSTWLISYKHIQFNSSTEYIIDSRNGTSTDGVFLNLSSTLIEYGYGNNIPNTLYKWYEIKMYGYGKNNYTKHHIQKG